MSSTADASVTGAATATAACPSTTITSAAEAASIEQCETINGLTVENYVDSELNLDSLRNNTGGLVVTSSPSLSSISFANLEAIAYDFNLDTLPALTSFSAPKLQSAPWLNWTATGDDWQTPDLPALQPPFTAWILETGLRSLGSLGLLEEGMMLIIRDNQYLTNFSMPYLRGGGNTFIEIDSPTGAIVDLPVFTNGSLNCYSGCASVSVPVLADCGGTGGLFSLGNSPATSLSLPSLKTCLAGLFVGYNPNLTDFSAPVLEDVEVPAHMVPWIVGISFGNNPLFTGALSFPALQTLTGGVFNGSFSSISMPNLSNETRRFSINSTEDISSTCAHFGSIAGPDNIIKGDYTCGFSTSTLTCTYKNTDSGMCTYYGASKDSNTGSSPSQRGTIIGGATGGAVAFVVLLVGLLVGGCILRMRRKVRNTPVEDDFAALSSESRSEKASRFTDEESGSSVKMDFESKPSLEELVETPKRA